VEDGAIGWQDTIFEGDESSLRQRFARLADNEAAHAGASFGQEIQLLRTGAALACAGGSRNQHLAVLQMKQVPRRALGDIARRRRGAAKMKKSAIPAKGAQKNRRVPACRIGGQPLSGRNKD
jgi:hypothetical protein